LHLAGSALATSQPAARQLLFAIPANIPPARQVPDGGETVTDLCAGAATTSERLRHLAVRSAGHGPWPPSATSACWRRDALAIAIIGHNSELILNALADRADQLGGPPGFSSQLRKAATTIQPPCTSWRGTPPSGDELSTGDSRDLPAGDSHDLSAVATEIGDLTLWIGRLARTSPGWKPARAKASPVRDPAD